MTHRPSPPEGTPRHLTAAFLQLEWADLGTISGLIRAIQRPPRPQVQTHRRRQVPPRLQESRKTITTTERATGLLTPFRESAKDVPTRLRQHLSCGKARPAASAAAANCRQVQQQWTTDLDSRLAEHAAGRGARLLEVVKASGMGWTLARTWPGGRTRERQIKNQAAPPGTARSAESGHGRPGPAEGKQDR